MNLHEVIVAPLVTEKTEQIRESLSGSNRYTLKVHPKANKELVRQAIYYIYKKNVVKVNIMVANGKMKRFRMGRIKMPSWKKAIVTLAPGESIDFAPSP